METLMSVIIPTYNRKESTLRLLNSLELQTLCHNSFEVIVIDDGSSDDTASIQNMSYTFNFSYHYQTNRGASEARNQGALRAKAKCIAFIDDDVILMPNTLEILFREWQKYPQAILIGMLEFHSPLTPEPIFSRVFTASINQNKIDGDIPFVECNSELLAIDQDVFKDIGMFVDPTGGWPNWEDVYLGYRASLKGYHIRGCALANGEHRDPFFNDLASHIRWWLNASKNAVILFQKYPDIYPHLPMFQDKTPINWQADDPGMIIKKILRRINSTSLVLNVMMMLVKIVEQHFPIPSLLRPLYRWVISGSIAKEFRNKSKKFHWAPVYGSNSNQKVS